MRLPRLPIAALSLLLSIGVYADASHEFNFARIRYNGGGEWPRWSADWPDAEYHFTQGLTRLTRVNTAPDGQLVQLSDDAFFELPWLYVVEVGYMWLSDLEIANLREYLLRGGFLMVDDFHGAYEWQNFVNIMQKVFPDRPIEKLDDDAEVFHVMYDLSERTQIPGIRSVMSNRTWEKGGYIAGWFGIKDDSQRLMVAINFNQDIGDAWEHADDAVYPEPFTAMAYRMGINYVLYAMTH